MRRFFGRVARNVDVNFCAQAAELRALYGLEIQFLQWIGHVALLKILPHEGKPDVSDMSHVHAGRRDAHKHILRCARSHGKDANAGICVSWVRHLARKVLPAARKVQADVNQIGHI